MDGKNTAVFGIHWRASRWTASLVAIMACGTMTIVQAGPAASSKVDIELTQRISRSIAEDKTASVVGQNVRISSLNGKVTLSGVVRTEIEKQQIGQKAASVAGPDNVINALEITPAK